MKKTHLLFALLFTIINYSQIPTGYYNSATGTGYSLKTQLKNIIYPHTTLVYGSGLWNLYPSSDVRPNGKVWDIYTTCDFTFGTVANGGQQDDGTSGTAECQRFNKEHTFPKSWFGAVSTSQMYSDAFHVMPADKKVNGVRGNLAYGLVGNASFTSSNGTKIGNCIAPNYPYSLNVIEPSDELKGDIARNYFYMATCYEDFIGSWQTIAPDGDTVLDGSNDKVFEQWYLELMYNWNIADPVSQKEIDRNNAIYVAQRNRNPYIDHPEWIHTVWATALNSANFDFSTTVSVFPNPTNNHTITIETTAVIDTIQLITINGQLIQEIKKPVSVNATYTLENLPQGFYFLKLFSNNNSVTKKISVN